MGTEATADADAVRASDAARKLSYLRVVRKVNRMVCEDCGTVYYSAAARTMVERGERCTKCGGRLVLSNGPQPARRVGVGFGPGNGEPKPPPGRDPPAGSAA
jgi:DNA-directed RNA polymerase subunit RPC12/RpoP